MEQIDNINSRPKDKKVNSFISSLQAKNIVLYGAGGIGYTTSNILQANSCNIICFIDDNKEKQGTYVNGIKVSALEELNPDTDLCVLICLPNPMEVYHRLLRIGYKGVQYYPVMMSEKGFYNVPLLQKNLHSIGNVLNMLADDFSKTVFSNILKHRITMDFSYFDNIISPKQYFPSDIFTLNNSECFVDGGVYNGETILDFINQTNNGFKYIYGFEPDKENFSNLSKNLGYVDSNRIRLFNSGLYSKSGEISFNSNGNSASSISETGKDKISLVSLDEVVGECKPTYIKLDIEGAEEEALYGMKNIIASYHPKLAISIYHKCTDLWELPKVIHNLSDSYKLYIRHYSNGLHETVCYAL